MFLRLWKTAPTLPGQARPLCPPWDGEIQGMDCCYERARRGDQIATEVVVDSLRPRLARMAAYYARCSGEDPDDLLQEAWLGLLEALPVLDLNIGSRIALASEHQKVPPCLPQSTKARCTVISRTCACSTPTEKSLPMPGFRAERCRASARRRPRCRCFRSMSTATNATSTGFR